MDIVLFLCNCDLTLIRIYWLDVTVFNCLVGIGLFVQYPVEMVRIQWTRQLINKDLINKNLYSRRMVGQTFVMWYYRHFNKDVALQTEWKKFKKTFGIARHWRCFWRHLARPISQHNGLYWSYSAQLSSSLNIHAVCTVLILVNNNCDADFCNHQKRWPWVSVSKLNDNFKLLMKEGSFTVSHCAGIS